MGEGQRPRLTAAAAENLMGHPVYKQQLVAKAESLDQKCALQPLSQQFDTVTGIHQNTAPSCTSIRIFTLNPIMLSLSYSVLNALFCFVL